MANQEVNNKETRRVLRQEVDLFSKKLEIAGDLLGVKFVMTIKEKEDPTLYKEVEGIKYKRVD